MINHLLNSAVSLHRALFSTHVVMPTVDTGWALPRERRAIVRAQAHLCRQGYQEQGPHEAATVIPHRALAPAARSSKKASFYSVPPTWMSSLKDITSGIHNHNPSPVGASEQSEEYGVEGA